MTISALLAPGWRIVNRGRAYVDTLRYRSGSFGGLHSERSESFRPAALASSSVAAQPRIGRGIHTGLVETAVAS